MMVVQQMDNESFRLFPGQWEAIKQQEQRLDMEAAAETFLPQGKTREVRKKAPKGKE